MYTKYIVKENDDIKTISNKFQISPEELLTLNRLRSDNLRAGMELIVPKNQEKYFNIYVIESGDSLYKIAEKYNINPTLLASLNGLDMSDYIYPAQELLIPKSGYSYYITAKGDTLESVSKLFKISTKELLNQNETIYLLEDQILVSKR